MSIKNELVSIVVITYNSEQTIRETIESLIKQTYRNIEIIVSDDCSSDNTLEVVNTINFGDIPLEVITSEKNGGPAVNANRGIKRARGEYVMVIAGDDRMRPNAVEIFGERYKENEICISNFSCFGVSPEANVRVKEYFRQGEKFFEYDCKQQYKELINRNPICSPAGGLIKKSLYEQLGYFDETYPFMEDYPFWIKCSKNGLRFTKVEECLVDYRISESSLSGSDEKGLSYYSARKYFWRERAWMLVKSGNIIRFLKDLKYFL